MDYEDGVLCMAPADVDRLYPLPLGEMKASERIKLHRKRSLQDLAKARHNAEVEIKFREWYEKKKELPNEFQVMPDPAQVFAEDKAIEMIDAIIDKNN